MRAVNSTVGRYMFPFSVIFKVRVRKSKRIDILLRKIDGTSSGDIRMF